MHNRQRKIPINAPALQRFAEKALAACRHEVRSTRVGNLPNEIHVLLVSDKRMSILHQRFLNQAGPTDVITFHHGEIFISVPMARRQAREFGTSLVRELRLYIVHGLLHLQGLDDGSPAGRRRMRAAETRVLRRITV